MKDKDQFEGKLLVFEQHLLGLLANAVTARND